MTDRWQPTTATYKCAVSFKGKSLEIAQAIADALIPFMFSYPVVIIYTTIREDQGWIITEQTPPPTVMGKTETVAKAIASAIARS